MSIDEWIGSGIPEDISDEAAHWIARLDSDSVDANDWHEFSIWLNKDPQNPWAFEELSEMWARLETLGDLQHMLDKSKVLHFPLSPELPQNTIPVLSDWQSITAMVLISIGLIIPFIERLLN
jgi:ferric-dicitrate binding protein FerR (iron transport regulator)